MSTSFLFLFFFFTQIENEFGMLIGRRSLATCCIYGGAPYETQERAMNSGVIFFSFFSLFFLFLFFLSFPFL